MKKTTLPVALIQERNHGDARGQPRRDRSARRRGGQARRASSCCCRNCTTVRTSASTKSVDEFDLAETIPGPSTERLGKLAKQHGVVLVSSLFEKRAAGLYHNTAVVFEADGSTAGKYRKMHIPDDPGFYEKFYFTPGDIGFEPIDTSVGRLGVLVCWDQWYPEGARLMALAGAELLLYPTAIGWDPDRRAGREGPPARCLDPQPPRPRRRQRPAGAAAATASATSRRRWARRGIHFWGTSHVLGPQGEFLAEARPDEPEILMAEVDMERSEHVRRIWPFLRDRRIDAYGDLLKRYRD